MAPCQLAGISGAQAGAVRNFASTTSGHNGVTLFWHAQAARRSTTRLQSLAENGGTEVQAPSCSPASPGIVSPTLGVAAKGLETLHSVQLSPANAAALAVFLSGGSRVKAGLQTANTVPKHGGTGEGAPELQNGAGSGDGTAAVTVDEAPKQTATGEEVPRLQKGTGGDGTAAAAAAVEPSAPGPGDNLTGSTASAPPAASAAPSATPPASDGGSDAVAATTAAAAVAASPPAAEEPAAPRKRTGVKRRARPLFAAADNTGVTAEPGPDPDRTLPPSETTTSPRSRVAEIKASLLRTMRQQTRTPSAQFVDLMLTPLSSAPPPPAVAEPLRAEPLPPPAAETMAKLLRPRSRRPKAGAGGARRQAADAGDADLASTEGMREEPRRGARGRFAEAEAEQQQQQQEEGRLLKPLAVRRAEAAGRRAEAAEARRAEEAARAAEAAARERQTRLRRANEEFADFVEGMAASVTADGSGAVGRRQQEERGRGWQQEQGRQGQERREREREREREALREKDERTRAAAAVEERRQQQQQQQQEQADLLRGLAKMFRDFAQRAPQPAAAAAAMVAAVSPAAAALASAGTGGNSSGAPAAGGRPGGAAGGGGRGPLGSFLGVRASVVNLILKPMGDAGATEEAAAVPAGAAGGGLRIRPLPTRADLLRLLRPVPRARLPTFTGRIGQRMIGKRLIGKARPMRSVRLDTDAAEAAAAAEAAGGGADLRALRMLPGDDLRSLRRRAYFYRVVKPRQEAAEAGVEAVAVDGAALGQEEGSGPPAGQVRPARYKLVGGAFRPTQRLQYGDRVRRVVRKSAVAAASGGVAAAAATAAAAAADGRLGGRRPQEGVAEAEAEAEAEMDEEEQRGEYNSAAEVVNDAYEEVMGVRLPKFAMYGKRAEALAALTPQDVRAKARAWIDVCGKDYTLRFHEKEPMLLTQPPESLLVSLEAVSSVFELTPDDAVSAALRGPQLIGLPASQLSGCVEAVSETLEIGMQEARKIVLRVPMLALREPTFPVSQRVALLGALLPVSRDKLRQVLRQRPLLLKKSLMSMAGFMMSASTALGIPLFDVALMIAGAPGVTGVSSARLASRWSALQAAASLSPGWREQLGSMSPPALGRCLVASEAAISRLQTVAQRGLAGEEDFAKLKRVLTMSGGRFDALLARGCREKAAAEPAEPAGAGSAVATLADEKPSPPVAVAPAAAAAVVAA